VHVLGTGDGVVVVEQQDRDGRQLVALGPDGHERWSAPASAGTVDAALRAGTVVLRTGSALLGLDAGTGRQRWRTTVPTRTQFFPYGFDLAAQPLLDDGHLLLGTTTALRSVDLRTGRMTSYPLPTDGINTTFWPYQVVVSGDLLAVVTNTGAVVLRRSLA
jgi:outer membrane protein assembly factor BamB